MVRSMPCYLREIQVRYWRLVSLSLAASKGVERPGLMSTLPTVDGRGYDMLDLGANAENTPEHLHQYAVMGSYYAENVRGFKTTRGSIE